MIQRSSQTTHKLLQDESRSGSVVRGSTLGNKVSIAHCVLGRHSSGALASIYEHALEPCRKGAQRGGSWRLITQSKNTYQLSPVWRIHSDSKGHSGLGRVHLAIRMESVRNVRLEEGRGVQSVGRHRDLVAFDSFPIARMEYCVKDQQISGKHPLRRHGRQRWSVSPLSTLSLSHSFYRLHFLHYTESITRIPLL